MSGLWLVVAATPMVFAAALLISARARRGALGLCALAPLPGLVGLLLPERPPPANFEWLLLGSRLGLDSTNEPFLLLTVVVWGAAGLYLRHYLADDPRRVRYAVFHLLTLGGNLGAVLALDVASFYLGFALMSFAAYGIIVHAATRAATRAGRVYIAMAVVGEALLVVAMLLSVEAAGGLALEAIPAAVAASEWRDLIIGLLFVGFGIKVGALPLHVWLPLAHPVAPTPGSAILSGCLIKMGLLGWMRFLPLGEASLPIWGSVFIFVGVAAAFIGVLIGVTERQPKVVLAYSSISQMGILNVAVGVGLADAPAWSVAGPAAAYYALHHGVTKGGLFLGIGVADAWHGGRSRVLVVAGLLVGALSLAGAPLTSGAAGKLLMKDTVATAPNDAAAWLDPALTLTALSTTLLMARFITTVVRPVADEGRARGHAGGGLAGPWGLLVLATAGLTWVAAAAVDGLPAPLNVVSAEHVWDAAWPVGLGALIAGGVAWVVARLRIGIPAIAPGDLLVALERGAEAVHVDSPDLPEPRDPVATLGSRWYGLYAEDDRRRTLARLELWVTRWDVATLAGLGLLAALVALAALS